MNASAAAHDDEVATLQRRLEVTEYGSKTFREMRGKARWHSKNCSQNARISEFSRSENSLNSRLLWTVC